MKNLIKLTVLKSIKMQLDSNQAVYAYNIPTLARLEHSEKGDRLCAYCGSPDTVLVGFERSGSVAGGIDSKEYKCLKCNNYSVYDIEWG